MKNNKSKKIFIISIIVLVIILIAGITFAVFATDLFKSDKDLFFKYASQMFGEENAFVEPKVEEYYKKIGNSAFENSGEISFGKDEDNLQSIVSFKGIKDADNNIEEDVTIKFSEDVELPVKYKKINDEHGIKIEELSKRFYTLDLKSFIQEITGSNNTFDLDSTENDKDVIDSILEKMVLTDAEKEKLLNNYFKPIEEKLDNKSFTKVSTVTSTGYSLSISNEKISEIIMQLCETLKDDSQMIEKLNSYGANIDKSKLEDFIENIKNSDVPEGTTVITVYQADGKLNKVDIQFNDEFKFSIQKGGNSNEAFLGVNFENQKSAIEIKLSYTGLQNLENVQEKHTVTVNGDTSVTINFENTNNFSTSETVDNFETKNTVRLSELESKKAEKIMQAFGENLGELITEKLQKSGIMGDITTLNPMNIVNQLQANLISSNSKTNIDKSSDDEEEKEEKEDKNTNTTSKSNTTSSNTTKSNTTKSNSSTSSSNLLEGIEQTEKDAFNSGYKSFEGDSVKGTNIKALLTRIIANNMVEDGHKIEVTGDIALTGDSVPKTVESSKTYKVEVSISNSTGYVDEVKITEN